MRQSEPIALNYSPEDARVLLVDDNDSNLLVMEEVLRPLGHTLVRASSGRDALREILRNDFALILLDVNMPGMDGYETAATIRQRSHSRYVPIIFITALHDDPGAIFRAYSSGAVDYLAKPFDPVILQSKVRVFIELHMKEAMLKLQSEQIRQNILLEQEREASEKVREIQANHLSELAASSERQRRFLYDVLCSVTEGRLRLCYAESDLPKPLKKSSKEMALTPKEGLAALRNSIREIAERSHFDTTRANDLISSASEAGMNAIVHGGGGSAVVRNAPGKAVQVWVTDRGSGITMESLPRATLERGYSTKDTLGHGFWLMLKLTDRVFILTGTNGTTIVLEQDIEPQKSPWE